VLNTQTLLANRVDGMLVSFAKETKDFSHFQQVIDNEIPMVFYDRVLDDFHADSVMVDDYSGAYNAVTHLISKGCQRIACYTSPQNLMLSQKRLEGYKNALLHHNMPFDQNLVYACDTYEAAMKISSSILKKIDRPDGVFAVNDLTAVGVIKVAKKLGIRIPEDLKVIGFENSKSASICEPELSSVDQFGFELGKKATNILLERIKSNTFEYEPKKYVLKTKLIIRESS
jgi:LacI family transcriptional regulator